MSETTDVLWLPVLPSMKGFGPALVKGAGKEAESAGKKTGISYGKAMLAGAAVIGTGIIATGKALYGIGAAFDDMTDTIRAGTGASGKALDGLVADAKAVGTKVPADFDKVGTTIADLNTRLGLSGDTLQIVARQYLEAGRILNDEVDINQTAAAFKAFGIEAEKIPDAMDTLFRASQATGVGMNELAAGVQKAAPALTNLGFTFADSVALMGSLDKAGLNSQQVAASLTRSLTSLAKSGEKPADAFQRIIKEMQGYIDKGETAKALELSSTIFGTRGASQFVKALQDGVLELDNLTAAAGVSEDSILGVANETKDFAEHWQEFKNKVLVKIEPVASALFKSISDGMEKISNEILPAFLAGWNGEDGPKGTFRNLGEQVRKVTGFLDEHKGKVLAVVGAFAAVKAAIIGYNAVMGVAKFLQAGYNIAVGVGRGLMFAVRVAVLGWTAAQWLLNAALSMNPIGLVVLALVGLGAALVVAWNKSETFRNIVTGAWNAIKDAASAVWTWMKDMFSSFMQKMTDVGNWFSTKATQISTAWTGMKTSLYNAWQSIKSATFDEFTAGIESVRTYFSDKIDSIKRFWTGMGDSLRATKDQIVDKTFGAFQRGLDIMTSGVRTAKDNIGQAWADVKKFFAKPINWVIDRVWNGGIKTVFDSVADAVGIKTRLPHAQRIPGYAEGGYHRGGWAMVGEEGPELVNFSDPARIYTASETARALAAGRDLSPTLAVKAAGRTPAESLAPMGGGLRDWASDTWSSIKSGAKWAWDNTGGRVIKWVRGGLAKAAGLVLDPIQRLIAASVGQWGHMGSMVSGFTGRSITNLKDWIRGHDEQAVAEGDVHGGPPPSRGGWTRPSRGPVTSRFGPRWGGMHAGIDIAGGGPTYAAAAGTVFRTGSGILGGRTGLGIGISHGGGVFTYYGHNPVGGIRVRPGQQVKAGQHIGYQGATGNVTGTHLHFELHRGGWGRAVNPSQLGLFDQGGWLQPGMAGVNLSTRPEPVFTSRQWDLLRENVATPREQFGRHMTLRVGEREFDAYVEEKTDERLGEHVADLRQSKRQLTGV